MNTEELMRFLADRRTYRRFDESRPVPDDAVRDMMEALRLASCGGNAQPLRYVFVRDPEKVREIFAHTRWAAALPREIGTPKEGERPVMFAALLQNAEQKAKPDTDAGLALGNLTLAAWAHGIGSCIMQNIDRDEIARILDVPETMEVHSVTAFGYPSHSSRVVLPGEDGSLKYYLDEDGNYCVPKLPADVIIRTMD